MQCWCFIVLSAALLWNIVESEKEKGKITIGQYPFMVQVNLKGKRVCQGTIISPNWILTAAHCIMKANVRHLTIRYGTIISNRGFTVNVVKKVLHPKHNRTTQSNDVALLQIGRRLTFTHNKKPVKLAMRGSTLAEEANATLIGWGIEQKDKDPTNYLDAVEIAMLNSTECNKSNETEELPKEMLCAGVSEGDEDICLNGGGGAPLIVDEKQVGIAVSKKGCDSLMFTSVGQKVIRDFIRRHARV